MGYLPNANFKGIQNPAQAMMSASKANPTNHNMGSEDPFRNAGKHNPWMKDVLPQYNSSQPYNVGIGGTKLDMRDPRFLAALALAPVMPAAAAGVALYAAGRQADNQRQDKRLEREYQPRADAAARRGHQSAMYGGTTGGSGDALAQSAYEQIMMLLLDEKRKIRQKQMMEEQQALGMGGDLLGYLAGGV